MAQLSVLICNYNVDKTLGKTLSTVRIIDCFVIETSNH